MFIDQLYACTQYLPSYSYIFTQYLLGMLSLFCQTLLQSKQQWLENILLEQVESGGANSGLALGTYLK